MTLADEWRPPTRVAIIDDHDVVHAGVEAWCARADPPIEVVGSFTNPADYFARFPDPAGPDVDVVLLDLQIDGHRPEWTALSRMCQAGQRVIVYSHMFTDEVILSCLEMGALTYVVKSEGERHLIDAIQAARDGQPYVAPRMANAMLNGNTVGRINLSEREKEVLVAWFQTESKDLVGKRLFIAPTTVRTHLQRARAKYAAAGRPAPTKSALLARAVEDGILSLKDL
ncbi:response regulator transcription factor [Mycolicibacterium sp. ELW1]|uniref:response regulator transcription factor n=1 Tax=Mycobacteriaceae TaxID=1762 RepID=UPI0011ECBE59|nr:response regulator transcription factor [Mycobacterium sp. ELW1]QEN11960.1 response regulator transcription factor [Mycobacterium sp. ELW1]